MNNDDDITVTDAMAEGGAEELYSLATEGDQWDRASRDVQLHFKEVVRRVIGSANTAELVARSKRQRVLPR